MSELAAAAHRHADPAAGAGPQIVFVGDIQGCHRELDVLLARLHESFGRDFVLYAVGDLVNRGPGSLRVLERIRTLADAGRARCVLGNHELHMLMVGLELRALAERDTFVDVLGSAERDDYLRWLRAQPIAITGAIGDAGFALVHASVHPEWDLDALARAAARVERELGAEDVEVARRLLARTPEQAGPGSPRDVLGRIVSCRTVRGERWSSALPNGEGVPWHEVWAKREHGYGVVYGHWALQGLHVARGLRGLDTGCVHHGRGRDGLLTAWLPGSAGSGSADESTRWVFDVPDDRFWQVPALARYVRD